MTGALSKPTEGATDGATPERKHMLHVSVGTRRNSVLHFVWQNGGMLNNDRNAAWSLAGTHILRVFWLDGETQ